MKKLILMFVVVFNMLCICCFAVDADLSEQSFGINLNSFIPQEYKGQISFSSQDGLTEKVKTATNFVSIENIMSEIKESFFSTAGQAVKNFIGIFVMIIISGIMGIYHKSFGNKFEMCEKICVLSFCVCVFYMLMPVVSNTEKVCENICLVSGSLITSLCSLSYMGGEILGSAVSDYGAMLIIGIIQVVCNDVLFPVVRIMLVISVCCSICESLSLKGVSGFVKSICMWTLGSMTTLFSCVLFLQKSVTLSADGLNMKLSKFAVSSIIPVVGSMVGESLRTVLGSVSLIKNTAGIVGIGSIIYLVIPPLCSVLIYKFIILICAFLSKAMGLSKYSDTLYEINGVLNILNSVIICVSLTFVIICAILMKSISI